jgi:phosphatidylserine/phosphatidylglycerophosphate/cardiolipin synthase-like enzyme
MLSSLHRLSTDDLRQLADALRSGWIAPPFSSFMLRNFVPVVLAGSVAADLQTATEAGLPPVQLGEVVQMLASDRGQRASAEGVIDLVWTGPDVPGIVNRDTGVVVREMFRSAKKSVLVAGYAVYQGRILFEELATRMDESPELSVQMYLNIHPPREHSSPSEHVRLFAERFVGGEWPGRRLPRLYYDPRSLEPDRAIRASLHAKCVVVDGEQAFVSSANFTEAAQTKNIEVGVHVRSESFARRLAEHFEILAALHILSPIPIH